MGILTIIGLLAGLYVYSRITKGQSWYEKLVVAVFLAAAASCYSVLSWFGGGIMFNTMLPGWMVLTYTWFYMTLMMSFVLLLVTDATGMLMRWVNPRWQRRGREERRRAMRRLYLWLLPAAGLLCGWGMYSALSAPHVREVEVPVAHLKKSFRIALLSDLHVDAIKNEHFLEEIVQLTNEQKPDLIVITGDFADGRVEDRLPQMQSLRELRAPLGVYAVAGNHEYYSGYREWRRGIRSLGIRLLDNEHVRLSGVGCSLAGVTDPAAAYFHMERPNLRKALSGIPSGSPVVLLAHQPKFAHRAAASGRVALQLSGHTHGGLVRGLDLVIAALNGGFVHGLYSLDRMKLYVSPGTSLWTLVPLRLGIRGEITVLKLIPSGEDAA